MFDVLDLYEKPYNKRKPVICLDESPCQLTQYTKKSISAKPGRHGKYDSEYKRCGVTNLFAVAEPLAGKHFPSIRTRKTGEDFAIVLKMIADNYTKAITIHLVIDNLNTHCEKSVTNYFGLKKGKKLWKRFTVHYTPKHGSWLNMAEIEIGVIKSQAIGKRRIGSEQELKKTVRAWSKRANKAGTKINWTFTKRKAKQKFKL
jgi:hypothetical protein